MRILITGPIGSGKTTQAKILSQELGIKLIQTGELVRRISRQDTDEAKTIRDTMKSGLLISDEVMAKILQEELERVGKDDYLIDSYPRRISQLKIFDPEIEKVVYLKLPDDVLEERLLARKRIDDTPEVIDQRFKVYHQETVPLLKYYEEQGKLLTIDATGNEHEVAEKIKKHLSELK